MISTVLVCAGDERNRARKLKARRHVISQPGSIISPLVADFFFLYDTVDAVFTEVVVAGCITQNNTTYVSIADTCPISCLLCLDFISTVNWPDLPPSNTSHVRTSLARISYVRTSLALT